MCCEVICDDGYYNCGTDSTDCCIECPPALIACDHDITSCCEVTCLELYHNCGDMLTECCIDTTSHEIVWEIDTLSYETIFKSDVEIINDNDIWIVGKFYQNQTYYNSARWNGIEWEIENIVTIYNSNPISPSLSSIKYFAPNDVWVLGGYPIHWNGDEWVNYHLADMGIMNGSVAGGEIWGSSPSDVYFAGINGKVVHFNGSYFTELESGTDIDIRDVHGTPGGEQIVTCSWHYEDSRSNVLSFVNGTSEELYSTSSYFPIGDTYGSANNVYVFGDTAYISMIGGIWKYCLTENTSVLVDDDVYSNGQNFQSRKIGLNNINDMYIVSTRFIVAHFNGDTWHSDNSVNQLFGDGNIWAYNAEFRENLIVVVGYSGIENFPIIARGYRR